jgi:hypothetical protein
MSTKKPRPPLVLPPGTNPSILGAVRAWEALHRALHASDDDADINLLSDARNRSVAAMATAPCGSIADLAAKIVAFVELANKTCLWDNLGREESDLLEALERDALALVEAAP